MADFLCIACDMKFPTMESLTEHTKGGHKTRGEPLTPNPEFEETVAAMAAADREKAKASAPPPTRELPPPAPIVLEYKYTGGCPTCSSPVQTLILDVEVESPKGTKKHESYAVCFCNRCSKQLQSRKVIKL